VKRSFPHAFLLKARDPATASIGLEARFEVKDRAELRALLEMPEDELRRVRSTSWKPSASQRSSSTMAFRLSPAPCCQHIDPPWEDARAVTDGYQCFFWDLACQSGLPCAWNPGATMSGVGAIIDARHNHSCAWPGSRVLPDGLGPKRLAAARPWLAEALRGAREMRSEPTRKRSRIFCYGWMLAMENRTVSTKDCDR
jgi:hypothetical protein